MSNQEAYLFFKLTHCDVAQQQLVLISLILALPNPSSAIFLYSDRIIFRVLIYSFYLPSSPLQVFLNSHQCLDVEWTPPLLWSSALHPLFSYEPSLRTYFNLLRIGQGFSLRDHHQK